MVGDPQTRPDPSRLRAACWSFCAIAAFVPLVSIFLGSPVTRVLTQALAYACLLTGLRGVITAHLSADLSRRCHRLAILAWISALSLLMANLPLWLRAPVWAWIIEAAVTVVLVVGIGLRIRDMQSVSAAAGLPELGLRWRRWGTAYIVVYGTGAVAVRAVELRPMLGGSSLRNLELPTLVLFTVLAAVILPSLSLARTAFGTIKALRTRGDRCPNCGYPRQGLPRDICPECGASAGREPDPAGEPPTQEPSRLARAALLPVGGLTLLALVAILFNPALTHIRWRPTWMLIRDAAASIKSDELEPRDQPVSVGWILDNPPPYARRFLRSGLAAQNELLRRLKAGALTPDQEREVAATALRVQADTDTAIGIWGDLFAECVTRNVATTQQIDQFVVGSMAFSVAPRSPVRQNDRIPFEVRWTWRGVTRAYRNPLPSQDQLIHTIDVTVGAISLDDEIIGQGPPKGTFVLSRSGTDEGEVTFMDSGQIKGWQLPMATANPGQRHFQVECTIGFKPGFGPSLPRLPGGAPAYETPRQVTLRAPIEILDAQHPVASMVADEAARNDLKSRLQPLIWSAGADQGSFLSLNFRSGRVPDFRGEFAFDILVSTEGKEYPVGSASLGTWLNDSNNLVLPRDAVSAIAAAQPEDVRVILRPSTSAATRTIRATKVLEGGDIELVPGIEHR